MWQVLLARAKWDMVIFGRYGGNFVPDANEIDYVCKKIYGVKESLPKEVSPDRSLAY